MNRKFRSLMACALVASVGGCASYQPVPAGYTGPTASVADSINGLSTSAAELFYVSMVDGNRVDNGRMASIQASRGQGAALGRVPFERNLPASKPTVLTLVARTQHEPPIVALMSTEYKVEGTVELTPQPSARYVVRGSLGEQQTCAVWLEDLTTRQTVGRRVEKPCAEAALGVLEK